MNAILSLSGQQVRGYTIADKIGEGGHGAVYRAYQPAIKREVAIKVILPERARQSEFVQRFETEARLVARLEHPHIVPLYDYWQDDKGACLVMRWLPSNLRMLLRQQNMLPLARVNQLLEQIAMALSVAHQGGVIHRDLKPENILLDERGNAYLTDFGIAKSLTDDSHITGTGTLLGTPAYLSPEQCASQPVSARSDIYSLGIMLYEMLAGEHPFTGSGVGVLISKHLQEPLPFITEKRPDLPAEIDDILQKATAKTPQERFSSVLELAMAFHDAASVTQDADTVFAPRPVPAARPARPVPATPEGRNRYAMLENVRKFWIEGVLENSLQHAVRVELNMCERDDIVETSWSLALRTPHTTEMTLPANTTILEVFDRLNGKLLILSDPGGGKTTTLLELARDLLYRAEADMHHPIPVVLNLSSWSESRKPMADWLADELHSKYHVPRAVAGEWVKQDALLLLLDGLDEVEFSRRDACVQAINAYREAHGFVDVVICSRTADYEALVNRLHLNGAIVLNPLTDEQVSAYLKQPGSEVATLRNLLEGDDTLRELSRIPLMLSIMVLAYQGISTDDIPAWRSVDAGRRHLFELYVRRALERRIQHRPYSAEQTQHFLSWLAQKMQQHTQSVFQIENLQPSWLTGEQNALYRGLTRWLNMLLAMLLMGLPALFIPADSGVHPAGFFLSHALFGGVMSFTSSHPAGRRLPVLLAVTLCHQLTWAVNLLPAYGLERVLGLSLMMSPAWFFAYLFYTRFVLNSAIIDIHQIVSVDVLRFSLSRFKSLVLLLPVLPGQLNILGCYIFLGMDEFHFGQLMQGVIGYTLTAGTLALLLAGLTQGQVEVRTHPNEGIRRSLTNALRFALLAMALLLAVGIFGFSAVTSSSTGLLLGLMMMGIGTYTVPFTFGGYAVLKHLALRLVLHCGGDIPRNYHHFLDYATSLILLRKVGGGYIFIHRYLLEYFAAV